MEYYTASKKNKLLLYTAWVNLRELLLSKRNQAHVYQNTVIQYNSISMKFNKTQS